jgi:hypothetical protein
VRILCGKENLSAFGKKIFFAVYYKQYLELYRSIL